MKRFLTGILVATLTVAGSAGAQVTTEHPASVLLYPKIVADTSGDSIVQIASLAQNRVYAFCTYVDGTSWQATSFDLTLDAHQPLQWTAARGRAATSAGDPNDVPAAPANFRGELLCVQVDGAGAPFGGNQLVGEATIAALASGDVDGYAAIGLNGGALNDGDDVLCVGGESSDACILGAEYDPCPAAWIVSHPSEGAADSQLGANGSLATRLTIAPCSQNVRDRQPATVDVLFLVTNEFEERFTGGVSVTCWRDLSLAEVGNNLFQRGTLGSDAVQTRLSPGDTSGAFVLVAEVERLNSGLVVARSADNAHSVGAAGGDLIVLPMGMP